MADFLALAPMLLMIDNHDSFTYNIVQYLRELGAMVVVIKNDQRSVAEIKSMRPQHIVISPGPGTPNDAGVSLDVIRHFAGRCPVLGICLGHQCIAQAFGARVVRARRVMHGKTSAIFHDSRGVFEGVASPFVATRYHSLLVDRSFVPDQLEVSAWTVDESGAADEIMGLRHKTLTLEGLQFHPESILSEHGHQLLRRFLMLSTDGAESPRAQQEAANSGARFIQ